MITDLVKEEQMKTYPVYEIKVSWVQAGDHDPKYPNMHKGLRAGRIRNSTELIRMYQTEKTLAELFDETMEWWGKYKKEKLGDKAPSKLKIKIKTMEPETWCMSWFSHWTFDTGQTDEEALKSFHEFVERKEALNVHNGHMRNERIGIMPFYCSMSANDRWRWSGKTDTGEPTNPPCRCKHCKERGIISIDH